MFTFVTNVTERVAAQLARDGGAAFVSTSTTDEGLVVVNVPDSDGATVSASFRRARVWTDRFTPPSDRIARGRPVMTRAAACTIRSQRDAWKRRSAM